MSNAFRRCGTLENPHCSITMNAKYAKYGAKTPDIKQMVDN